MSNPFETIYKYNLWITGSGTGSLPWNNRPYLDFVNKIIVDYQVGSILDIGCGDCRLWNSIVFSGKYIGVDIVDSRIPTEHKYANSYLKHDIVVEPLRLDQAIDLVIIKDLFVHLPREKIDTILKRIEEMAPKYLLIVEDTHYLLGNGEWGMNIIREGSYRPIQLDLKYNQLEQIDYYEITYLLWINLWIMLGFVLLIRREYIYVGLVAIVLLLWIPRKRAGLYKIKI